MKNQILLVLDSLRSANNVGSILRTCDGLGVKTVLSCGTTPHPRQSEDKRLPHVIERAQRQIAKTALGAEDTIQFKYFESRLKLINYLKDEGYMIVGLELTDEATSLVDFKIKPDTQLALIVGNEVDGVSKTLLGACDQHLMIPMLGKKESFNVASATAIGLYHLAHISVSGS